MSLTRAQWVEMWNSVKTIENVVNNFEKDTRGVMSISTPSIRRRLKYIRQEIPDMKTKIQDVIGQME